RRYPPRLPGTVVGVASERNVLLLDAAVPPGEALELLDAHQVAGKQLHQSGDGHLTLVISRENLHDEPRVRRSLATRFGDRVQLDDELGALSIVGAGINASFANLRRGSDALASARIRTRGVATSSFRITWMVDRSRLDEAVRLLHAKFIEEPGPV